MNLLGKLLIVLIFIGSIGLATTTIVLYATHTNWKVRAEELDKKKKELDQNFKDLQNEKQAMIDALTREIKRQADRILTMKGEVDRMTAENDEAEKKLAELELKLEDQVAVVQASLDTAERLRARLDGASKALLESQNEWVAMSTELIKKMDEANSLAMQLTNTQTMAAQLAKDYKNAVEVLRIHGLKDDPALYSKQPPAGVRGNITAVRQDGNVQISIGSDSGLVKGHQLDVIRERNGIPSYIGKIEITNTTQDQASAAIMREFRQGTIQIGDVVTYIEIGAVAVH